MEHWSCFRLWIAYAGKTYPVTTRRSSFFSSLPTAPRALFRMSSQLENETGTDLAHARLGIQSEHSTKVQLVRKNTQTRLYGLSEDEKRLLERRQSSKRKADGLEEADDPKPSHQPHSSFQELPHVSRAHIFTVVALTLVCAPSVMLTAHVSTRTCWVAESNPHGLEECGDMNQGQFQKPWFLVWFSYVGQTLCLLVPWINHRWLHKLDHHAEHGEANATETKRVFLCECCCGHEIFGNEQEADTAGIKVLPYNAAFMGLVPTFSDRTGYPLRFHQLPWSWRIWLSVFPAATDVAMSVLQFLSLLYLPPSLTVMFKSLSIVWVTLFSSWVLPGRKVLRYQYLAVGIALSGGALIATSAILQNSAEAGATDSEEDSQQQGVVLGIVLAVLAGLCAALSSLSMEKMMVELDVEASTLVGVVGLVGLVCSTALLAVVHVLPGSDPDGKVEDLGGTVRMLGANRFLLTLMVLYGTVVSAVNNWCLGEAAHVLSSVAMLLIRNVCTVVLWAAELALFYGLGEASRLGSELFLAPGLVKLGGFLTMSFALLLYLGYVTVPFHWFYADLDDHLEAKAAAAEPVGYNPQPSLGEGADGPTGDSVIVIDIPAADAQDGEGSLCAESTLVEPVTVNSTSPPAAHAEPHHAHLRRAEALRPAAMAEHPRRRANKHVARNRHMAVW